MTHPHHKQVGQHGDANGFLTAVFVPADLVLAQPKARFKLPVHQFNCPAVQIQGDDLLGTPIDAMRRGFGEKAGEVGFVSTLEHTAGDVRQAFVVIGMTQGAALALFI